MATAATLITDFELQVNDITELSSVEELALLNRIYLRICRERPWEFLKKTATGTLLTDSTGSYITIPSDFAYFVENYNYTNNSLGNDIDAAPKVIFMGDNYDPYQIVNFSDRRQYRNRTGFAYLDLAAGKIRFTGTPTSTTYEFDYIKIPPALSASDSPIFPSQFHEAIPYAMASENDILQISPKAKSYAVENQAKYLNVMTDMQYWNANLLNN